MPRRGKDGRFAPVGKVPRVRVCRCRAYAWPHRTGGGLCRWPAPPAYTHPTPAGCNRPRWIRRRGMRAWLIRHHGLHPIRDQALIEKVLPTMYRCAAQGWFPSIDEVMGGIRARGGE